VVVEHFNVLLWRVSNVNNRNHKNISRPIVAGPGHLLVLTAIFSLNSFNQFLFVFLMCCAFFALRTEFLNVI
jgi:hypothetical protein